MVGNTGVVRARATQKRPALDDQLTSAHGTQIGRTKSATRTATQENRVVFACIVLVDIEQRMGLIRNLEKFVNLVLPFMNRPVFVADIRVHTNQ